MDGQSRADQSFLARPFVVVTRLILAHPWATLIITIGLAIASIALSTAKLGYRTSRLDLLNPKSPYNRLWLDYVKEFGDEDDAIVVVEGAGREAVIPVLDELGRAIQGEQRLFHDVLDTIDLSVVRSKGLFYLSIGDLRQIEQFLASVRPIVGPQGNWSLLSLGNMAGGLTRRMGTEARASAAGPPSEITESLQRVCGPLASALDGRGTYESPWPQMQFSTELPAGLDSRYVLAKDGRFGFISLRLLAEDDPDSFIRGTQADDALRKLIAEVQARHPETKIGLTGLPIMENDEMASSQSSMFWSSMLSMAGVAILFVAGFGGIRHALLANLILLIGMAWSFAYVTLSVGHLNILSVSFTATLIGIGIDYGIYYAARYLQLRRDKHSCEEALLETGRTAGPAIITGAITTSVAFFAAGLTSFTGVAELGIIAGGGLLLCALAELWVLPAAIYLIDRSGWGVRMPAPLPINTWITPFVMLPRLTIAATLVGTVLLGAGLSRLWYDNNLLNMQAKGLESVALEQRLLRECDQSAWYALSVCDTREQLLARKAKFEKLRSVSRTEEIVSLLPDDVDRKQPIIRRIAGSLANLPEQAPLIPVDRPEALARSLGGFEQMLVQGGQTQAAQPLQALRAGLTQIPSAELYKRLSNYQQQMAADLLGRLHELRDASNPQPPRLTDLPPSLVNRFIGKHGRHLLRIYGRGNTWDTMALNRFTQDLRRVDPRVTGNPLQAHEASLEMKSSYQEAAIYSLLAIIGVLVLDFRNLRDTLLAALPLGLGVVQAFGLMGLLNIPLNPANLIALPLILGIGVDYGVHIVHEYREQSGRYRMSPGTAVAVLVDALTTIVGYGAMMIATHQGLQSLGRVLTIAVTCCLLNSLVFLPALLTLLTRNRIDIDVAGSPPNLVKPVARPVERAVELAA